MSALTWLLFNFNTFEGTLPTEIWIVGYFGDFGDPGEQPARIPTEIGLLSFLQGLTLDANSLQGTIPSEVGLMGAMRWWFTSFTKLEGTIPTEFGMMTNLIELEVIADKNLSGQVPVELANLTNLRELLLANTPHQDPFRRICVGVCKLHGFVGVGR